MTRLVWEPLQSAGPLVVIDNFYIVFIQKMLVPPWSFRSMFIVAQRIQVETEIHRDTIRTFLDFLKKHLPSQWVDRGFFSQIKLQTYSVPVSVL